MFEASIQPLLAGDGQLSAYLNTYGGFPAVFSELAPEGAKTPYLVYRINRVIVPDMAVESFSLAVDLFDFGEKRGDIRKAAQRIEFILDTKVITTDTRYNSIRLRYENAGPVPGEDPRDIHYNLIFSARAGRQAWAQQL